MGRRDLSCLVALSLLPFLTVWAATAAGAAANLPLPSGVETPTDSWTVLPMGQFGDPANTFWQLLHAAPGSSAWSVVTPEGVADNGGLVAAGASGGSTTIVGFLPSQLLHFSPLSASNDSGRAWNPVFLPGALAARPDALASGPDGSLAIVGTAVLHGSPSHPSWSRLVTLGRLARLAPRCQATALDAVAVTPTGAALVGTSCRNGRVGLFTVPNQVSLSQGITLGGNWGRAETSVVRMEAGPTQTTALVLATQGARRALFALWRTGNGVWARSAPLSLDAGSSVRATAVNSSGALSLLIGSGRAQSAAAIVPGGTWATLPAPPRGAVALAWAGPDTASSGSGALDVFTVTGGTELTVFVLTPTGSKWVEAQAQQVTLPYGSSS